MLRTILYTVLAIIGICLAVFLISAQIIQTLEGDAKVEQVKKNLGQITKIHAKNIAQLLHDSAYLKFISNLSDKEMQVFADLVAPKKEWAKCYVEHADEYVTYGTYLPCDVEGLKGECQLGETICHDTGQWSKCQPFTLPGDLVEQCENHMDDDCDGQVDEAECEKMEFVKTDGSELCNGKDDNGNGTVDEGCACSLGKSQTCFIAETSGIQDCINGEWTNCMTDSPIDKADLPAEMPI